MALKKRRKNFNGKDAVTLCICSAVLIAGLSKEGLIFKSKASDSTSSDITANQNITDTENPKSEGETPTTSEEKTKNLNQYATPDNSTYMSKHLPKFNTTEVSKLTVSSLEKRGFPVKLSGHGADHKLFTEDQANNLKPDILLKDIKDNYSGGEFRYFDPFDITKPSNLPVEAINAILPNILQGQGIAELLYEIEHGETPVNSLFIISLCYLESAGGVSDLAQYKKNLFGLAAYDKFKSAHTAYMNALKNEGNKYSESEKQRIMESNKSGYDQYGTSFETYADCIKSLVNDYLLSGYLKPGNWKNYGPSVFGINVKYSTPGTWSCKIIDRAEILEDMVALHDPNLQVSEPTKNDSKQESEVKPQNATGALSEAEMKTINKISKPSGTEKLDTQSIVKSIIKEKHLEVSTDSNLPHLYLDIVNKDERNSKFHVSDIIEKSIGRTSLKAVNPLDVREVSGLTKESFEKILPDNLKPIAQELVNGENSKNPINGLYIASLMIEENISSTHDLENRVNTLYWNMNNLYASGKGFETVSDMDNIMTGKPLKKGAYFNGYSIVDINKYWADDLTLSSRLIQHLFDFEIKLGLRDNSGNLK